MIFLEWSSIFDSVEKISSFAELCDDVAIVDSGVYIKAFDDIDVAYLLESLYFEWEVLFDEWIGLSISDIYDFDGYFVLVGLVDSSEDVASFGEIEVVVQSIGVVLYLFSELVSELSVHYLFFIFLNKRVEESVGVVKG